MNKVWPIIVLAICLASTAFGGTALREVSSTSCKAIPIELGVGMTTQIIFEQEPKVTLFADQTHFKVVTNATANRSIAIIPVISQSEIEALGGRAASQAGLVTALNSNIKTNLFVFFENNNQLMFELKFTDKRNADYLVKVKQVFNDGCVL